LCGEDERVVVPDGEDADGDDERQAIECELRADVSALLLTLRHARFTLTV
jgi:hypothetical protein